MEDRSVLQPPLNGDTTIGELESLLASLGMYVSSRIKNATHYEVLLTRQGKPAVWGQGSTWWAALDDGISQLQGAADVS